MQNWLGNNDILMYSTHNEDKSMVVERFARTLKGKKIAANGVKSCLAYLNELVYECNNNTIRMQY